MPGTSAHPVRLLGLPTDEASSFARGAAEAPRAIRAALFSDATNLASEVGVDLGRETRFEDLGDLDLPGGDATRTAIERAVADQLSRGARLVCLGGDHSVSYPILRAYARHFERLTVVQLDAHPDLYDEYDGNRYSHACPFARVMEERLVDRLVQVGVRAANEHQRRQAERFGVEIVPRGDWSDLTALEVKLPVYLSLDLDALDPAFAPGVSHPEAGGLTTREALDLIWRLPGLVGADLVELNPSRDPSGITAAVAGKLVKEIAARLFDSPH